MIVGFGIWGLELRFYIVALRWLAFLPGLGLYVVWDVFVRPLMPIERIVCVAGIHI